jgi:capsular polysaccharide biosynthesis protein
MEDVMAPGGGSFRRDEDSGSTDTSGPVEASESVPSFVDETVVEPVASLSRPRLRRFVPPWFRRRWWLLLLCLIAGTSGGYFARTSQSSTVYSASAELAVVSGASGAGPGSANDADALAVTYASIIPLDQLEMQKVADSTRLPLHTVTKSVSVVAVSGTSAIVLSFKAASGAQAIKDVNLFAEVVTIGAANPAIPRRSLTEVKLATSASRSGELRNYGIPLGIILGLLIGAVAVLAIERADPRVDDVEDLAAITGTPATLFPGTIQQIEMARSIALAGRGSNDVTLVPLSKSEEAKTEYLWNYLSSGVHQSATTLKFIGAGRSRSAQLAEATGPTVLVVKPNTRSRVVHAAVLRLQVLEREPVWAVLVAGKLKQKKRK